MDGLLQIAFLKALGWSLLHSLWQMGLLSLLYILITSKGRRWHSQIRHNLALLLSGIGGISFLVTFVWEYYYPEAPLLYSFPLLENINSIRQYGNVFQLMASIYLVIVFFLLIRFIRQFQITRQLRNAPGEKAPLELRLYVKDMALRLGIKRNIDIRLSEIINTPLTIGFWKPVILLPVALMNHLSLEQAESILLHELNHIRRNDYLINIFIASLDILMFFNPFARFFTYTLVRERENHCDDMVLQFRYRADDYAKALLILEQRKLQPLPVFTIRATGNNNKMLLQRVQRIIYGKTTAYSISPRMIGLLLIAAITASISIHEEFKKVEEPIAYTYKPTSGIESSAQTFTTPSAVFIKGEQIVSQNQNMATGVDNTPSEEELAQLAALIQAAEIEKKIAEANTNLQAVDVAGYATNENARDFSLAETNLKTTEPEATIIESTTPEPYIPGNSFSYQTIEDSTVPKKTTKTASDVQAAEDLAKTLKAIESINWIEIEKNLKAQKNSLDIVKLQQELKKALTAIDWKKVQSETQAALTMAEQEMIEAKNYQKQLESFRKAKAIQQEYENNLRAKILLERLNQSNSTSPKKLTGKSLKKPLKIVVI